MVTLDEAGYGSGYGGGGGGDKQADRAVQSWRTLFCGAVAAEQLQALRQGFTLDAIFEDNLVLCKGTDEILSQFRALRAVFPRIEIEVRGGHEVVTGDSGLGITHITLHNKQNYQLPGYLLAGVLLPRFITLWSETHIYFRSVDGIIVKVVEKWHNVLPLPHFAKEFVGHYTSKGFKLLFSL